MKRTFVLFTLVAAVLLTAGLVAAQEATDEPTMMTAPTLYVSLNPAELANDGVVAISTDMDMMMQPGMMDEPMMTEEAGTMDEPMMTEEAGMMDEPMMTEEAGMMDESMMTEEAGMMTSFGGFEGIVSVQSIDVASDGTAYITVDVAEGEGGILVVEGLAMADSMSVGMGTRMIGGTTAAGLVAPKGLEVIESLDLVLVANFGAPNIKGFSLDAEGDAEPTVFIDNFGGATGSVWDVHYDEASDTLFAAGTTGTLLVFANFSGDLGANGPTRLIVPSDADGNPISVNLHGVAYDAVSDTVILTDVGSADDATDGQIFTIAAVSDANGNTPVTLAIAGAESMLGNPVDVTFDGSGIYVAEKSNDAILYFADILGGMGMMMGADGRPSATIPVTKPESVTLHRAMGMMGGM